MRLPQLCCLAIVAATLNGCAYINTQSREFVNHQAAVKTVDPSQRVIFSVNKTYLETEGTRGKSWTAICDEPSPDPLVAYATSLGVSAKVAGKAINLAADSDISSIDAAIKLAMQDKRLNNVMLQYFPGVAVSCDVRDSFVLDAAKPSSLDEPGVQALAISLFDGGLIKKSSLDSCIINFILPAGTVLKLGSSTSTNGLGGYHGSVRFNRAGKPITLYYSANVYSEVRADGRENGIAVFNKPWKNVVGTLYHELNEFRTDPDVNDAIVQNNSDFLGWNSRSGREVGDQPIFAASNLNLVFKEIKVSSGTKRIPVQFMYSNAVHGAEGPIAKAHV